MSSCRSVTYGVVKELTKILKPLVGKSPHHINSTYDFVEQVEQFTLAPGNASVLMMYLLWSPQSQWIYPWGLSRIYWKKKLHLKDRTVLPVKDIILLLEFCLKNMCFSFQDQFYEQVKGVAMGSPVSPIVANLYMEYFEQKALSTAPHPKGFGWGMWMTHLSSRRNFTSRTS